MVREGGNLSTLLRLREYIKNSSQKEGKPEDIARDVALWNIPLLCCGKEERMYYSIVEITWLVKHRVFSDFPVNTGSIDY